MKMDRRDVQRPQFIWPISLVITHLVSRNRLHHTALRCSHFPSARVRAFSTDVRHLTLASYLLAPWRRVLLEKLTGSAAIQEIPRILSNPKVHYRIHKCPPQH